MSDSQPTVVGIFNTSADVVDLLRRAIEPTGMVAVSVFTKEIREGAVSVDGFLREHDPQVVVYDIAPPYDANWRLFQHVASMELMRDRPVVLTTTNAAELEKIVGKNHRIFEIVGKPYDLDQIVRAVKEAARSRPTR
jgi:DNA-binding NtrC family response regulator